MDIKLLRDWRGYKAGRVLTLGDGAANVLIRRGFAVAETPDTPEPKPTKKPAPRRSKK